MHIGNRGTVYGFARGNDMGSMFHQYKYSDRYICYLMNIYALLKCKRFNEAKQEYTKYIEFIDTTDSYFRPDTLDKVTIYFESLSDKDDTSELASEIVYPPILMSTDWQAFLSEHWESKYLKLRKTGF